MKSYFFQNKCNIKYLFDEIKQFLKLDNLNELCIFLNISRKKFYQFVYSDNFSLAKKLFSLVKIISDSENFKNLTDEKQKELKQKIKNFVEYELKKQIEKLCEEL